MATNITMDDLIRGLEPFLASGVRVSLADETIVLDLDGQAVSIIPEGEGSYLSLLSLDIRRELAMESGLYPWDFVSDLDLDIHEIQARVAFINTISHGGQTTCGTAYAGPKWLRELGLRGITEVVGYTKNDSPIYGLHQQWRGLREAKEGKT